MGRNIARGGEPAHDTTVTMSPFWNRPTRRHHDFGGLRPGIVPPCGRGQCTRQWTRLISAGPTHRALTGNTACTFVVGGVSNNWRGGGEPSMPIQLSNAAGLLPWGTAKLQNRAPYC